MTTANVTPTLMFSRVLCGVLCAVRRQVLLNSDTGKPLGLDRLALHAVDVVTLENNSYVQVSINKEQGHHLPSPRVSKHDCRAAGQLYCLVSCVDIFLI
jgi:hypothetical protein